MKNDIEINANTPITAADWTTYISNKNPKVWIPIGTNECEFAGIFDGKYHSIKGMYVNTTTVGGGLFRSTAIGSNIKNIKIENSYINSAAGYVGSIVGAASGNINSVYSNATINVTDGGVAGGIVGQMCGEGTMNVGMCWFAGNIVNKNSTTGGIIGFVSQGNVSMKDCLNTGTLEGSVNSVGGLCARTFRSTDKFAMNEMTGSALGLQIINCLSTGNILSSVGWSGSVIGRIQHIQAGMNMTNVYATEESYQVSGTATTIGNGSVSSGSQNPKLIKMSKITVAGDVTVDNVKSELDKLDFNLTWGIGSQNTPELAWVNNLNVDVSWYDESKTIYTIGTKKQLYGLSSLVESGVNFKDKTINLSANITLNEGDVDTWKQNEFVGLSGWTPIGTSETEFAGTFNGNGYSIIGLYVNSEQIGAGLFRSLAVGSTVQNVKLEEAYINTTAGYAGSIAGVCSGNIVNVHSDATINATSAVVGGLVGQMHSDGTMNLTQCQFTGTITNTKGTVGGIVGFVSKGIVNMTNCLNKGTLKGAVNSIGGLIGRTFRSTTKFAMDDTAVTILGVTMTNCLNTGNILSSVGWTGSIIGRIQHIQSGMNMTNVYATEESYKVSGTATTIGLGNVLVKNQKRFQKQISQFREQ